MVHGSRMKEGSGIAEVGHTKGGQGIGKGGVNHKQPVSDQAHAVMV